MSQGFVKIFERIHWKNRPSVDTPLGQTNLNKMDLALDTVDTRVVTLDTTKADQVTVNGTVTGIVVDEKTGVMTVTWVDGSTYTFDFNIEKIPASFSMSAEGVISLYGDDGELIGSADLRTMIPTIVVDGSDTINVAVSGEGKDKTFTVSVKAGSITEDMLQPNYLADIRVEAGKAQTSANSASESSNTAYYNSQLAQSYAIGTGGEIREGDATDNAKYYKEQIESMQDDFVTVGPDGKIPKAVIPDDIVAESTWDDVANKPEDLAYVDDKTKEQYEQMSTAEKNNGHFYVVNSNGGVVPIGANQINYNNSASTLDATNVGSAITELDGKVEENESAISELNSTLSEIGKPYSLILGQKGTTTLTSYSTYNNRKFSDYDLLIFRIGVNGDIRDEITLSKNTFVNGYPIIFTTLHGSSSSTTTGWNVSSATITYISDTSYSIKLSGSATLDTINCEGIKL